MVQRVKQFAAVLRRAATHPTKLSFAALSASAPKAAEQAKFFLEGDTVRYNEFIKHFGDLLGAYLRGEIDLLAADASAPTDDVKIDFRYLVWSSIKKMTETEAEKLFDGKDYCATRSADVIRTPSFMARDMSDNITFLHFYYYPKTIERLFVSYPRNSAQVNRHSFYRSLLSLSMLGYLELELEKGAGLSAAGTSAAVRVSELSAASGTPKMSGLQKILSALSKF